ncbi:MAG: DUF4158 domain-containing protein [Acaryochloris sp. CRU_2_0]|nr:DUF4158 domain-containing protein [Acaryochloris sp. CRU_2_0]
MNKFSGQTFRKRSSICQSEFPEFTFFTLNQAEEKLLTHYRNARTQVYFILQLGYFKAKQQFFDINFEDVLDDVSFVVNYHFGKMDANWIGSISRDNIRVQKRDILGLFSYRNWSTDLEPQIQNKLRIVA